MLFLSAGNVHSHSLLVLNTTYWSFWDVGTDLKLIRNIFSKFLIDLCTLIYELLQFVLKNVTGPACVVQQGVYHTGVLEATWPRSLPVWYQEHAQILTSWQNREGRQCDQTLFSPVHYHDQDKLKPRTIGCLMFLFPGSQHINSKHQLAAVPSSAENQLMGFCRA